MPDRIRSLRRELGRNLASWRHAAGFSQAELGRKLGYSRSTVSTVESGGQQVPREFWESCDDLLATGGTLTGHFDLVALAAATERRRRAVAGAGVTRDEHWLDSLDGTPDYADLGWPIARDEDRAELLTGDKLDALEVSRPAGTLAVQWWLGSGGVPDPIRGLPSLPPPAEALAVIAADTQMFFLVASGACPWAAEPGPLPTASAGPDPARLIRWHATGSRVPLPPAAGATWMWTPSTEFRPLNPVTLLDLLAKAVAATRTFPGALALRDGILAVPATSLSRRPRPPSD